MAENVHKLLTELQTGEYVTDEKEKIRAIKQPAVAPVEEEEEFTPVSMDVDTSFLDFDPSRVNKQRALSGEAMLAGYGQSKYDKDFDPYQDIENRRAIEQSGFARIMNGVARGGFTTVTTAVNTTAGLLANMITGGGAEMGRQIAQAYHSGDISDIHVMEAIGAGVDNFVTRNMDALQNIGKELFPGYRTLEERSDDYQNHWFSHILSSNSVANFLENFGFTVGAIGGGMLMSKVLSSGMRKLSANHLLKAMTSAAAGDSEAASVLGNTFSQLGKGATVSTVERAGVQRAWKNAASSLTKFSAEHELFGSLLGAMGEGLVEGEMARNEFLEGREEELDQKYLQDYDNLEDDLVERLRNSEDFRDKDLLRAVPVLDENGQPILDEYGNPITDYELNDSGKARLSVERQKLAEKYYADKKNAILLADRLAGTTYLLNIPVLTVSNTIEFGKAFSRGFRTARKNVSKVAGGLVNKDGRLFAEYTANAGKRAVNVLKKTARAGVPEAAEEMAQGAISSGATRVADDRLTSFNDSGYDRNVLRDYGQWYDAMAEGAGEYLGDWANWQEGFMGLVTGLIGLPGGRHNVIKNWRGGVIGAFSEAKAEDKASQRAADILNEKFNDKDFLDAFAGWVRHEKANREMEGAAVANDKYAWETASDKQLIGDIIMFANAGRLQDLTDFVDYYAKMTDEEAKEKGIVEMVQGPANSKEVQNNPFEAIQKVRDNAAAIKDMIQVYSEMYDSMTTLAPTGASEEHIQEILAASMNIKAFEKRFLGMYDSLIKDLDTFIEPLSHYNSKGDDIEEEVQQKQRAKEIYRMLTDVITSTGSVIEAKTVQDLFDSMFTLGEIDDIVHRYGNEDMIDRYEDMKKLAEDRRRFLKKLATLKEISPEDFNDKADDVNKAAKDIQTDNAENATADLETFDDIRKRYMALPADQVDGFVELLRDKAPSHKPTQEFVGMLDAYDGFIRSLSGSHKEILKKNGDVSNVANIILQDILGSAISSEDLVNKLADANISLETVSGIAQDRVVKGEMQEEEALPQLIQDQYSKAMKAIKETAEKFRDEAQKTKGRENLKPSEPKTTKKPVDDEEKPTPTVQPATPTQTPNATTPTETPAAKEPEAEKDEPHVEPREVSQPSTAERDSDVGSGDKFPTESASYRQDSKGYSKLGYYQQSIPEIAVELANRIRDLMKAKKHVVSKEEMEAIDAQLNMLSLLDFVQFDEDGKVIGGEAEYAETYKWLKDNHAFEYIATKLHVNDEVVFTYMKDAPLYEGSKQIVVAAVTGRNDEGEITSVQPLTVLHSLDKTPMYMNLDELYDDINEDYKNSPVDGDLYVFGGKKNPITSKVWGKRPGIVRYASTSSRIDKKDSYDSNNPIIVLDENDRPVFLRGTGDASKIFTPNIYPWSSSHYGRLYYMVDNGDGGYTPIFVDRVAITPDMIKTAPDGGFLADVRDILTKMDTLIQGITPENLEVRNKNLHKGLKQLTGMLNLDGIDFEFQQEEDKAFLHIQWGKNEDQQLDIAPGGSVTELLDKTFIPVRLSPYKDYLSKSRENLEKIIQDGLLVTDAQELRQIGMNFMFDPWNPKAGKFERILDSPVAESKKSIPESGPQNIANDAEIGSFDDDVDVDESYTPSGSTTTSETMKGLDDVLTPEYHPENLDYENLDKDALSILEAKKITKKKWDSASEDERVHYLKC